MFTQLTTLGHPRRMAVFRLLMRRYPDEVPAGEIAVALGLKSSTLSVYLSALTQAGLIGQTRLGTSLRYRIKMKTAQHMIATLFNDCCGGRPDLCPPMPSTERPGQEGTTRRRYNVLFLCTGNSARSIFAESLLRTEAGDRFVAYSAGTRPVEAPNPLALKMLGAREHDISLLRSKSLTEYQAEDAPKMDFVFTVCDHAANEDCPAWRGQPISAHWGLPDPVKATGTDAEKALAFQKTYGALHNRILAFAALPIDTLDRVSLQHAVDDIARDGA